MHRIQRQKEKLQKCFMLKILPFGTEKMLMIGLEFDTCIRLMIIRGESMEIIFLHVLF